MLGWTPVTASPSPLSTRELNSILAAGRVGYPDSGDLDRLGERGKLRRARMEVLGSDPENTKIGVRPLNVSRTEDARIARSVWNGVRLARRARA